MLSAKFLKFGLKIHNQWFGSSLDFFFNMTNFNFNWLTHESVLHHVLNSLPKEKRANENRLQVGNQLFFTQVTTKHSQITKTVKYYKTFLLFLFFFNIVNQWMLALLKLDRKF